MCESSGSAGVQLAANVMVQCCPIPTLKVPIQKGLHSPRKSKFLWDSPGLPRPQNRQTSPLWGPHLLKFPLAGSGMLGGPTTSHIFSIVSLTVINYRTPSEYFLRVSGLPFGDH